MLIFAAMRLNLADDIEIRFPGLYRDDLIRFRMKDLGWSQLETCKKAKIHPYTLQRILTGQATSKKVWPLAKFLGLDWAQLHNFKLKESEFHLAVVRNGARSKSVG